MTASLCRILTGDVAYALRDEPADTYDALLTDPPGGFVIPGAQWKEPAGQRDVWIHAFARRFEPLRRVLKPGAFGLVWSFPRTSHWTATALENAGFEILDLVVHLQAQGMAKSPGRFAPAAEPWIFVRKPGPARALVLTPETRDPGDRHPKNAVFSHDDACTVAACAPDCPVAELDRQSGVCKSGRMKKGTVRAPSATYSGRWAGAPLEREIAASEGPASRFFWCPKARGPAARGHSDNPAVKPVPLMRHFVRLLCPAGGALVDGFAGSGAILEAAFREGVDALGVEINPADVACAEQRLARVRAEERP